MTGCSFTIFENIQLTVASVKHRLQIVIRQKVKVVASDRKGLATANRSLLGNSLLLISTGFLENMRFEMLNVTFECFFSKIIFYKMLVNFYKTLDNHFYPFFYNGGGGLL